MINITSDIASNLMENTGLIIQQLLPIIGVLLGIIITFYIARKILFLFSITKR